MGNMRKHLRGLLSRPDQWKTFMKAGLVAPLGSPAPSDHLTETPQFGSNPGALRMFSFVPPGLQDGCPLVVVLHGCTQSAASYDLGAGWSTLAERFGFALLLPEQQRLNNPNGCFNWFQSGDIERGHGEAASIRQMVMTMVSNHGIHPARVFVTEASRCRHRLGQKLLQLGALAFQRLQPLGIRHVKITKFGLPGGNRGA